MYVIVITFIAFNWYTNVLNRYTLRTMKTFIFIMVTMNGFAYGIETDKETCYSEPESFMELKRDPTTELLADGNHQWRYFRCKLFVDGTDC